MAAASKSKTDAMSLITFLTRRPSSWQREGVRCHAVGAVGERGKWLKPYPQWASFLAGADYSKSIPPVVTSDGARRLQPAAAGTPTTSPKSILDRVQQELQAILS